MNITVSTNFNKNNTFQVPNNKTNITSPVRTNQIKDDAVSFGAAGLSKEAGELLDDSIKRVVSSGSMNIVSKGSFHSLLDRLMPEIMTGENFINKGRESKVYRISDDYVAKIRRGTTSRNATHFYNITTRPNHLFNDIDIYYGEPLIRCGNVEILRNATPTSDFVHCGMKWKSRTGMGKGIEYYEQVYLPTCSSLPQESFDELARGLNDLNKIPVSYSASFADGYKESRRARKCGCPFIESFQFLNVNPFASLRYTPDVINPNNILISDGRFRIVDKMNVARSKQPNSLFTMLEPLLIRLTPDHSATYKPELVEPRMNIFRKSLIAAEKAELPLESSTKDEFSDFYLGSILRFNDSTITTLKEMRQAKAPLEERIQLINERVQV